MAIYYPPPQPVQARPRAPIPAQGDQPPRLKRAQQDAPSLWEPLVWRSQRRSSALSGLLVGGDAPPRYSQRALATILSAWNDQPTWPILVFEADAIDHDDPPWRTIAWRIWEAWRPSPDVIRPQPKLVQSQAGDQPPRFSITTEVAIRAICEPRPWRTQTLKGTAAWNVPVATPADDPPGRRASIERILDAWTRTGWPAQFADQSAAWNASVDNPPPFKRQALERIADEWQSTWDAQCAAPNAGWNVEIVVAADEPIPRVPQWHIWTSWQTEPHQVQQFVNQTAYLNVTVDVVIIPPRARTIYVRPRP